MNYSEELNKVINQTVFTYRGVICERLVGGFRVFDRIAKNQMELDEIINSAVDTIGKSITVGSQEVQG